MSFWLFYFPWILLGIWSFYALIVSLSYRASLKTKITNYYVFESIPSVFITLGLLGTFMGITYGLLNFKTEPDLIKTSIQELLDGLKLAFLTSIYGIVMSLVFGKMVKYKMHKGHAIEPEFESELKELKIMNKHLQSLSANLANSIDNAIVQSLKGVVEDVNDTFKKFIDQLVSENFQRLTESIDRLTEWQETYHKEIVSIKQAYESLVSRHESFVNTIQNWVETLDEIAGQTSHLRTIIDEFKSITDEDARFSKIIHEVKSSTSNLQLASEAIKNHSHELSEVKNAFLETRDQINDWLTREDGVRDSVVALSHSLEELRKFDIASIEKLDESFSLRLSGTFKSLDDLMKEYIIYLENRSNNENKKGG